MLFLRLGLESHLDASPQVLGFFGVVEGKGSSSVFGVAVELDVSSRIESKPFGFFNSPAEFGSVVASEKNETAA